MFLYLSGHPFHFECENLCRVFYPYSPVERIDYLPIQSPNALSAKAIIEQVGGVYTYTASILEKDKETCREMTTDQLNEYTLTRLLFDAFSAHTGNFPKWGLLTGIHPVKLFRETVATHGASGAIDIFRNRFLVSAEKTSLCQKTLSVQQPYLNEMHENLFSLYIAIPFCPSRCSYCSFVSHDLSQTKRLIEPYFFKLLEEIRETGKITASLGLLPASIYVGGGTPTTLTAAQLEALCQAISSAFTLSSCKEFCIEAGRPETLTADKLYAMKYGGVTRISINPQSMSNRVLAAIGRSHTAEDILNAFRLATQVGSFSINSDLIVGLPEDTLSDFSSTLDQTLALGATNVTVHALAIKRAAQLTAKSDQLSSHRNVQLINEMADHATSALTSAKFSPYYLYRQSRMAGNLENIGYAINQDICRYNIYTMDESSSIIACGAGGVSKLKDPNSNRLERIFNMKHPYEYIDRHDEMLARKKGVITLYEQFRQRLY